MHNSIPWLDWFNRQKIVVGSGSLALGFGAFYPWYQLSPQGLDVFGVNLFWINIGRLLAAIMAVFGFVAIFYFGIRRLPRLPFWGGLILALLFPYFVTTWSPTVSFLAKAYSDQGDRVSKHVARNFSEIQAQWKQGITFDLSVPIESIFDIEITDSRFFQLSSWDRVLLDGFGYKDSFFASIGKGWGFAVVGLMISLMGLYLEPEESGLHNLLRDLRRSLPGIGVLLGIIICSLIWVNMSNYDLAEQFAKGEYKRVVNGSKGLALLYPPLKGDTAFMERWAKASLYASQPDQALINFAKGVEYYRLNDLDQAEDYLQKSLAAQPHNFLVREYLATVLLNQGVGYFNNSRQPSNRRPGGAVDLFEQALQIFPTHIEGLYELMIARVVNGEFDKSAQIAKQIIDGEKYFQQPNLPLMGQAYLHMGWNDFASGNMAQAWKRYRQSLDNGSWEKSLEEQP